MTTAPRFRSREVVTGRQFAEVCYYCYRIDRGSSRMGSAAKTPPRPNHLSWAIFTLNQAATPSECISSQCAAEASEWRGLSSLVLLSGTGNRRISGGCKTTDIRLSSRLSGEPTKTRALIEMPRLVAKRCRSIVARIDTSGIQATTRRVIAEYQSEPSTQPAGRSVGPTGISSAPRLRGWEC